MTHASTIHSVPSTKETEYLEGWKRARAELANIKQRLLADQQTNRDRLQAEVLEPLLGVADNFRALIAHVPEDRTGEMWTQGAVHIARDFERVLSEVGLKAIDPGGSKFDPTVHEAVEKIKATSKTQPETIVEVVQVGYQLGDRVLRPAKVKVAK